VDEHWVTKFGKPQSVGAAAGGPEQIWINYGRTSDVMVVGWITSDMNAATEVHYGTSPGSYTMTAGGNATFYKYSTKYTSGLIHHAYLTGLAPGTKYYYVAGPAGAQSAEYSFTSNPGTGTFPYVFGFIADIGEGSDATSTIQHCVDNADIDTMVINGDISYASGCERTGCGTWDAFQRMAQPLSATKPFAVNIGNHECDDNANGIVAISTRYRFAGMPFPLGSKDDLFYFSYNAGPAHVISVSSFYPGGFGAGSPLTTWLKADLAAVDRSQTPWVLVSLHAPWYNSNTAHQGDGEAMRVALEPVMIAAGVNAVFSGHVHAYERSHPVDNNKIVADGQGMVHFNIGDAGASLYTTWEKTPAWSAYHSATFGHGVFRIQNKTTATWEWHRDQDAEVSGGTRALARRRRALRPSASSPPPSPLPPPSQSKITDTYTMSNTHF